MRRMLAYMMKCILKRFYTNSWLFFEVIGNCSDLMPLTEFERVILVGIEYQILKLTNTQYTGIYT